MVFTDEFGDPLTGLRITERRLRPLLRREGLPPIRFHDLRHTPATLMLTAGVNPKVVSEMLGHTSVAITLDRYSHVMPTMQADAVRRLDGVLSGRLRVQMRVRRIPQPRRSPDSRSQSGPEVEIGTAYRISRESSHASHPRSPSTARRRMRPIDRIHKGSDKGPGGTGVEPSLPLTGLPPEPSGRRDLGSAM